MKKKPDILSVKNKKKNYLKNDQNNTVKPKSPMPLSEMC